MTVLQAISLVKTPTMVSILSVSGQTSIRTVPSILYSPERIPPQMAAPHVTASSGLIPLEPQQSPSFWGGIADFVQHLETKSTS